MPKTLLLATLLLAAPLLAPSALAAEKIPPDRVGGDVGPCHVSQTFMVDNTFTTVSCAAGRTELFYHRSGSGIAGFMCTTRVLGVTVHDCRDGILP